MTKRKIMEPWELAEAHWEYIRTLLDREIAEDMTYAKREYIELVGCHYREAMIHGIKHGKEDK